MAEKQTSSRILKNVAYGSISWLLPLILSFAATPVIIGSLGITDYGIYALIIGFISYSFTFAIGRAITKYVAEFRVTGETERIGEVVSATLIVNLVVGSIGILVIVLTAEWLVVNVLRIEESLQAKSVNALYIAAFVIFFGVLGQAFSAVLQGLHRFDVYSKIFNASSLILVSGNVLLAVLGYGLSALMTWSLVATALASAAYMVAARSLLPEFGIRTRISGESWRLVLSYSSGVVGYQILANVVLLFERGWIIRRLGPDALSYYVVPMMIGTCIHGFIGSLMLVIFPLASELDRDRKRLENLYLKATKIVSGLVVFMALTLITLRRPFLEVYLGADFAALSSELLILHTLSFGCFAILTISWQMTEGLGHPGYNFRVFTLCAGLALPLMVLLIDPLGSFGVAVARLVGFGTVFFSIFFVEKWVFGGVRFLFWFKMLAKLAVAAFATALVEAVLIDRLPVGWPSLALVVAAGTVAYASVLWLVGFVSQDERVLVSNILNRRND